ncbi:MAG: glycosyltransferase [Clostridiales bacterium]|mgnify:CR=1 FL=1|nr:glycosyltransferase [Clostridiales bacterium]
MSKGCTLIFLSSCAVDSQGQADPFMCQELPWLRRHFDRVMLVSYYGTADLTQEQPSPLPVTTWSGVAWRARLRALWQKELWGELGHLCRDHRLTPSNVIKLLLFAIRGQKLHLWTEKLLASLQEEKTTLYAYWLSYEAYAAALSKARHPGARFIARGHAFDIDPKRNPMNPYLMKAFIARYAESIYFISHQAKGQYLSYGKPFTPEVKLRVVGMGSQGEPVQENRVPPLFARGGEKAVFHLLSCATISEIKQLPLLVDALAQWEGVPIHWLHMGGGPGEAELRAYTAARLSGKTGISYEITGSLTSSQVQEIYHRNSFDVFINTSRMEGVPVSIMEAMRFGIPVIAPCVGGIPELVDESLGILYDPSQGIQGILEALKRFTTMPRLAVEGMRAAAKTRWEETCRSEALLPLLFPKEAAYHQEGSSKDRQAVGSDPQRILIISYCFAPQNIIGAVRPTKLAKYLARRGHQVTVLCGPGMGGLVDPTLQWDLNELSDVHVVREWNPLRDWKERKGKGKAQDQEPASNEQRIPRAGDRSPKAPLAQTLPQPTSLQQKLRNSFYLLLSRLADRSFARRGWRTLKAMNRHFDVVISSYGPHSVHQIAGKAKAGHMADQWVADFRDPVEYPFSWQRRATRRYVKRVKEHADQITGASPSYLEAMGLNRGTVVFNGFDPEDLSSASRAQLPQDCLSFVYCGQMYRSKADLRPFFRALWELIQEGVVSKSRVRLDFAGKPGDWSFFFDQARESGLESCTRNHGMLPRDQAIGLQLSAHALLVASWNTQEALGVIPGKLLEALMFNKPVICCVAGAVPSSVAKWLITQMRVGHCFEEAEGEAGHATIKAYLRTLCLAFLAGEALPFSPDPQAVQSYAYPQIAGRFEKLMGLVIHKEGSCL